MRKKIALIFGGRSLESDISVITAMQVLHSIDRSSFIVEPIYLFDGDFYVGDLDDIEEFVNFNIANHSKVLLNKGVFYKIKGKRLSKYFKPDCALLCCHGGEGENGVVQAVLQFNNIPYTSTKVLQSAVGMNKITSKHLFESLVLNILPYFVLQKVDFKQDLGKCMADIEGRLEYPLIVKPACQGSSIGIEVANDRDGLEYALKVAFSFDDTVLVEHKLVDFVEVNCAAYRRCVASDKNDKYADRISKNYDIVVSATEQPTFDSEYLTFDDKYMGGGKMSGGSHIIPANIGELNDVVRKTTRKIYEQLQLDGVVRVDYLVDIKCGKVYVNEINTIPGSMAFYLFESRGITFDKLIGELIDCAISRNCDVPKGYKSNVLMHFAKGGKISK